MRQTRKRQKENDLEVREDEDFEAVPKKLKGKKTEAKTRVKSKVETESKYFKNGDKAPLTPMQNEDIGAKKGPNEKTKTSKLSVTACDKQTDTGVKDHQLYGQTSEKEFSDQFTKDLLTVGLQRQRKEYRINVFRPAAARSRNMIHYLEQLAMGMRSHSVLQKSVQSPFVELFSDLEVLRVASPFDRRVTALEWHPTRNNVLAIGSKGGDILLWDVEAFGKEKQIFGIGAAGSCQAMKFWPWDLDKVVSASINGTVTLHDFETQHNITLADTMDSYDHWYCSVDVHPSRNMVVAGRNHGILHVMSQEGRMIFEHRLHKNKVTHVEFSPREEWLLCTASTDQTVQLWDIRQLKDRTSALQVLKHEKPVNSAYFSHTDGCRLLTTDQGTEIRVYRSPSWHLENTISHPHRFFQHITPFKATWHPLQDLIVCGRYPDPNFPGFTPKEGRSIDLFEADSGQLLAQLSDPTASGLCCLNKFNRKGDALASGMGFHTILWNRKEVREVKQEQLTDSYFKDHHNPSSDSSVRRSETRSRPPPRPRPGGRRGDDDTDSLKKKKKGGSKTSEKTDTSSVKLKTENKMSKKKR